MKAKKTNNSFACGECGKMVAPKEKHTYDDCLAYKKVFKKPKTAKEIIENVIREVLDNKKGIICLYDYIDPALTQLREGLEKKIEDKMPDYIGQSIMIGGKIKQKHYLEKSTIVKKLNTFFKE